MTLPVSNFHSLSRVCRTNFADHVREFYRSAESFRRRIIREFLNLPERLRRVCHLSHRQVALLNPPKVREHPEIPLASVGRK
jgi:hypothetical protein